MRDEKGRVLPGNVLNPIGGRPKGAKGIAAMIANATDNFQDMVNWCLLLWKDVDAPIEWRWKAFEWLSNRGAGTQPTTAVLNVTNNINSGRDLRALTTDDLERIDDVFKTAHSRKVIDTESEEK